MTRAMVEAFALAGAAGAGERREMAGLTWVERYGIFRVKVHGWLERIWLVRWHDREGSSGVERVAAYARVAAERVPIFGAAIVCPKEMLP